MKGLKVIIAAVIATAAMASSASAQGTYAGASLGFSGGGGDDNFGYELTLDGGVVFNGFFGKEYGNARLEGEIAYRQNDMESFTFLGVTAPALGEMSSLAFMGNLYYDFGSPTSSFRPYVGIGLGLASVTMNSFTYDTYATETSGAVQLMIGGTVPLSGGSAVVIDLRSFAAVPTFVDGSGLQYDQGYGIGSLMIGYRQGF